MKRIAIIEDDKIVGSIYEERFQKEGFHVSTAIDGEAGLALVEQFKPDVLVLDLGLPKINGVEVIRRLRASAATAALPILVISNSYQPKLIEAARKAGANKCLRKFDSTPQAVCEAVKELLPTAVAPSPSPESPRAQPNYLVELAQNFIRELQQTLEIVYKSPTPTNCRAELDQLHRSARNLTGCTALYGRRSTAQLSNILEALLEELLANPTEVTPSTLRTVSQLVGIITEINQIGTNPFAELTALPPSILVVDDDTVSRELVCLSLEKAGLNSVNLGSAKTAIEVIGQNRFDLIFLDAIMPDHTGYEICEIIRQAPEHEDTPIIFVTGQHEFEDRALSTICGSNDLLGKPFLPVELAAKALFHLFSRRLKISRAEQLASAA